MNDIKEQEDCYERDFVERRNMEMRGRQEPG